MFSGISFSKPLKGPWGILTKLFSPDPPFDLCPVCSQHSKTIQNPQTLHRAWKSIAILAMITSLLACLLLPSVSRSPEQSPFQQEHPEYLLEKAIRDYKWGDIWQKGLVTGRIWMLHVGQKEPISEHIWHAILSHSFDPYHPLKNTNLILKPTDTSLIFTS